MQNLFVKEDDMFEVNFSVAIDKKGTLFCDLNEDLLKEGINRINGKIEDFDIQNYYAKFKKPSFGDVLNLYDSLFSTSDGTNIRFNPLMTQYRKIAFLIREWNLSGEPVKPTEDEILRLSPAIASAIGIVVDLETGGMLR